MAKRTTFTDEGLPTAILKRDLLAGMADKKLQAEHDPGKTGDLFFSKGRLCEALDFYEKCDQPAERVARIKAKALEDGDYFLLARIVHAASDTVSESEWASCGDTAATKGKLAFAVRAYERAGDGVAEKLAEAKRKLEEFLPSIAEAKMAVGATADQVAADVADVEPTSGDEDAKET